MLQLLVDSNSHQVEESADFKDLVKFSSSFNPSSEDWASPNSFTIALPTMIPSAPHPATYEHTTNTLNRLHNEFYVLVCDVKKFCYLFHVLRFRYTEPNCYWFLRNLSCDDCEASMLFISFISMPFQKPSYFEVKVHHR